MMSWSACLLRSATDQLGPHQSARPTASYTISWDIIFRVLRAYHSPPFAALPRHARAVTMLAVRPLDVQAFLPGRREPYGS